jgi:hypothetical protein
MREHYPREVMATRAKLYALPGSHPCAAVKAARQLKSVALDRRVDLLPITPVLVGPVRWAGRRPGYAWPALASGSSS